MAKYEFVAPKTIESLKDLLIEGEEVEMDLEEDAWEFGAPPPKGDYDLKLFLAAKDGYKVGYDTPGDENSMWLQFNLECRIVNSKNGEYDDIPVFTRVNTKFGRGKSISTMAGLIVKLGYKIPNRLAPKKLALYMDAALKKEPVVRAEIDWRGAYSYKDKDGKDVWENVFNRYEQFPNDPEKPGSKLFICEVTGKEGRKVEVRAQTQINRFYGKGEGGKVKGVVAAPKFVEASKVVEVKEPQLATPVATEEDDFQLVLA